MMQPLPPADPTRPHPDPQAEALLRVIARAAKALARLGAADHVTERVRQAVDTGRRLGGLDDMVRRRRTRQDQDGETDR